MSLELIGLGVLAVIVVLWMAVKAFRFVLLLGAVAALAHHLDLLSRLAGFLF